MYQKFTRHWGQVVGSWLFWMWLLWLKFRDKSW